MKLRTRTIAIIYGLFCILNLWLIVNSIIHFNIWYLIISIAVLPILISHFIIYTKMTGKIYCNGFEIKNEIFGREIINYIDENLEIKFGLHFIKIINQHKIYLDKENDENNVIETIYTFIKNNSTKNDIVFPFIYKIDFYITGLLNLLIAIIAFVLFVLCRKYNVNNAVNYSILSISIIFFCISVFGFLLNKKIIFEDGKIILSSAVNHKSIIPMHIVDKIEINIFENKLCMDFYYKSKKLGIGLNSKTDFKTIKNIYLLERYFDKIPRNNGHFA